MNNQYMMIHKKHNGCVWYVTGNNGVSCEPEHAVIIPTYEEALKYKHNLDAEFRKDVIVIGLPFKVEEK